MRDAVLRLIQLDHFPPADEKLFSIETPIENQRIGQDTVACFRNTDPVRAKDQIEEQEAAARGAPDADEVGWVWGQLTTILWSAGAIAGITGPAARRV